MPRTAKIEVVWDADKAMWLVAGGVLEYPTLVSSIKLREMFPEWVKAAEQYVKKETLMFTEDDLESIIGCAANSLAENVPKRKRFAVYLAVAFFLGYKDRTPITETLEEGIKSTWSEPGETFTGYKEGSDSASSALS